MTLTVLRPFFNLCILTNFGSAYCDIIAQVIKMDNTGRGIGSGHPDGQGRLACMVRFCSEPKMHGFCI